MKHVDLLLHDGPLDVAGVAEVVLNALGELVQVQELLLAQGWTCAIGWRHVDLADPARALEQRLLRFVSEDLIAELPRLLVDAVRIRGHAAFDHL